MAHKNGVPPVGPAIVDQPPVNPGAVRGVPLNPQAAAAAAKTHATASDMFTWIAVGCAGAAAVLFFCTIFVSTAFAIPYAISMVATIAFGFLGDCTKPKAVPGQPLIGQPGHHFLPPPPAGPQGAQPKGGLTGMFGGWFAAPKDPAFVDGQPVQLNNDGSSCFIDAAFQEIMVWTEMKDALVETCQGWDARFTAFNKLIVWLKEHKEADKPTAADVPLIISLIATSDFGARWYANIKNKAEARDAPEALQLFDEYVKAFKIARNQGEDDPEMEAADIEKILPLFDYDPHWTSQNIDTFIQVMKWLQNPRGNPAPRANALVELVPLMSRPEYQDTYFQLVEKPLQLKPKPLAMLVTFDEQVRAAIEERNKVKVDEDVVVVDVQPEAAPQLQPPAEPQATPLFDFLFAAHFVGIARDLSPKMTGIKGFLEAVKTYDEKQAAKEHRTGINLSALRNLLPNGMRLGQQDSMDMMRLLCNLVDTRKYPDLFFPLAMEQRYVPYDPNKDPENAQLQALRLSSHSEQHAISDISRTDPLPPDSRKIQNPQPNYELQTFVPNQPAWGEQLFNGLFEFHEGMGHEPIIYLNPETGKPALYQIAEERIHVEKLPDTFMFTLKRFGMDHHGRGFKNHMPVVMPEYIQRGDDTYEIQAIMLHGGAYNGGHYVELSKKDGTWWVCDDLGPKWNHKYVYPATIERDPKTPDKPSQLEHALTYGYQYLLKKCDKPADGQVHVLKNWPPQDLPAPPPPPPVPKARAKTAPAVVPAGTEKPAAKKDGDGTTAPTGPVDQPAPTGAEIPTVKNDGDAADAPS